MPRSAPGMPRKMLPPPTTMAISTPSLAWDAATSSAMRWTMSASMPKPVDVSAKTSPESFSTTRSYRDASPTRLLLLFADLDPDEPSDGCLLAELAQQLADRRLRLADERLLDENVRLVEAVQAAFDDLGDGLLGLPFVAGELLEHGSLLVHHVGGDIVARDVLGRCRRDMERDVVRDLPGLRVGRVDPTDLDEHADVPAVALHVLVAVDDAVSALVAGDPTELDVLADLGAELLDGLADRLSVERLTLEVGVVVLGHELRERGDGVAELVALRDEVGLAVELDDSTGRAFDQHLHRVGRRGLGRSVASALRRGRRWLPRRLPQARLALLLRLDRLAAGATLLVGLPTLLLGIGRGRLVLCLAAGLHALAFGGHTALLDGVGDDAAHERGGADGVVVAGDHVVDDVGIAVGVDDRDDGDAEPVGLGHRDVLLLGVDHEDGARELLEAPDTAEVPLQLREVTRDLERFLLGHGRGLAGLDDALELAELGDPGVDGLEVRQRAAQPPVVHIGHAAALRLILDRLLRLLLGADEQDRPAVLDGAANEPVGGVDPLERLLQIDDVDAVALTEDETAHLRVPTARLVAEMDAGLQQLLHGDDSHGVSPSVVTSARRARP